MKGERELWLETRVEELEREREEMRSYLNSSEIRKGQAQLLKRAEAAEAEVAVINAGKSPCGHWSAHAMTNDGGKTIRCLECENARLRAALNAARDERDALRDKYEPSPWSAALRGEE